MVMVALKCQSAQRWGSPERPQAREIRERGAPRARRMPKFAHARVPLEGFITTRVQRAHKEEYDDGQVSAAIQEGNLTLLYTFSNAVMNDGHVKYSLQQLLSRDHKLVVALKNVGQLGGDFEAPVHTRDHGAYDLIVVGRISPWALSRDATFTAVLLSTSLSPGVLLVSGSDQVLGGGEERRESRRDEHSSGPERATPRETGNRRSGQTGKRRRQARCVLDTKPYILERVRIILQLIQRSKSLGVRSDQQEQIRNGRNKGIAADQEAEQTNVRTEVNTEGVLDGRRCRVRARGAGMFGYSGYGSEMRRSEPKLSCSAAEAGGWYRATVGRVGFG
ncbi:hypothetical protein BKA70DRAFT_1229470 [Coprinopsis sp. MPI-PUGE-AT-0042]|nr:hypothetical protein BKA70DRAFT_1229470 [Coprinopsis sp. MPI-PUGE-AT-0042]